MSQPVEELKDNKRGSGSFKMMSGFNKNVYLQSANDGNDSFHSCLSSGFTLYNDKLIQNAKSSELPSYMKT